jgi:hypothetical protein
MFSNLKSTQSANIIRKWRDKHIPAAKPANVSITLFETQASLDAPQKTVVVGGVSRGGTTSVAAILRDLGVFLGSDLPHNLEDTDFHVPFEQLPQVIDQRSQAHDVWGWKHPDVTLYLDHVIGHLPNPRLVFVTRDPTSVAVSQLNRNDLDVEKAMQDAVMALHRNLLFSMRLRIPTLMVSYEKLVLSPVVGVAEIAAFMNIELSQARQNEIAKFVKAGRYRTAAPG